LGNLILHEVQKSNTLIIGLLFEPWSPSFSHVHHFSVLSRLLVVNFHLHFYFLFFEVCCVMLLTASQEHDSKGGYIFQDLRTVMC